MFGGGLTLNLFFSHHPILIQDSIDISNLFATLAARAVFVTLFLKK
jgi:hypothetical protein